MQELIFDLWCSYKGSSELRCNILKQVHLLDMLDAEEQTKNADSPDPALTVKIMASAFPSATFGMRGCC